MMNNQLNVIPDSLLAYDSFEEDFGVPALQESLATLSGKRVIFRADFSKEAIPLQSLSIDLPPNSSDSVKDFSEFPRNRTVASIDSSCTLIGETAEGSIYAGRVTTVLATKGSILRYFRAGPVIFYFEPATIKLVFASHINYKISRIILSDRTIAERFIRNYLERRAQIQAACSLSDGIIVADGALRTSVLEQGRWSLRSVQDACKENFNQLIGFSKASSLKVISNAKATLQSSQRSNVFLDLTDSIRALLQNSDTNRIAAVKFSLNCQVFRVDFSSSNIENDAQLLSDFKYNDSFFRGYPESLRLAHHLSVFDSSTVSSVRSYLAKKYHLIQVPSDDLRATILGKLV